MVSPEYDVRPIGTVSSTLVDPSAAPHQGDEGAPQARVEVEPTSAAALEGLAVGDRVVLLTWLHLASRDVLAVRPRDDPSRPLTGVFATRSQDRPNPIGLHEVAVLEVGADFLLVDGLEAVDGTPVLDIKPVLGPAVSR